MKELRVVAAAMLVWGGWAMGSGQFEGGAALCLIGVAFLMLGS